MNETTDRTALTKPCDSCSGSGVDPTFLDECSKCDGTGRLRTALTERPQTGPKPATERQVDYAVRLTLDLIAAVGGDEVDVDTLRGKYAEMTARDVSRLIDQTKAALAEARRIARENEAAKRNAELAPGMYRLTDGRIAKVQQSKAGRLYAKVLTDDGFEYEAGAIRLVERPLTLDEAKEYGHATGICCVCASPLTNPESVAAGIGPVCARKF